MDYICYSNCTYNSNYIYAILCFQRSINIILNSFMWSELICAFEKIRNQVDKEEHTDLRNYN